jgi:hypothetical protein
MGYIHDEGVMLETNRIHIEAFKTRKDLRDYGAIYKKLFYKMVQDTPVRRCKFIIDKKSRFKVGIFIADLNTKTAKTHIVPSITLEIYLKDQVSKKAFFMRFSTANQKELYYAMRLSVKRIFLTMDFLRSKNV